MRHITMIPLLLGLLAGSAWAQPQSPSTLPDEVVIEGESFILIPAGWSYRSVSMWDHKRAQYPLARVWIDAFYMAKYEARAKDLARFLNKGGEPAVSLVENNPLHQSCVVEKNETGAFFVNRPEPNVPASGLSWEQADAWARWLTFRLPTEAEWEKAARGPDDQRLYPWGEEKPIKGELAIFGESARGEHDGCSKVVPVDQLPKGVSPYGIYNMAGNIREYVADHSPKAHEQGARFHEWISPGAKNPFQRQGDWRILKGGRWADNAQGISISYRHFEAPDRPFRCNGARFAVDVEAVQKLLEHTEAEKGAS